MPRSLSASCRFYPTPVLPPTGCPLFPPSPCLSQIEIFGWFLVLPSPLFLKVSCLSFFFFSLSAAFSFFSFFLSSAFRLYSSFLLLAFFLLFAPCPLSFSADPSSPGLGLGSEFTASGLLGFWILWIWIGRIVDPVQKSK